MFDQIHSAAEHKIKLQVKLNLVHDFEMRFIV